MEIFEQNAMKRLKKEEAEWNWAKGRVFNLQVVVPKSDATARDFNGFGLGDVELLMMLESFGAVDVTVIGGFKRWRSRVAGGKKKRVEVTVGVKEWELGWTY